MYTILSDVLCTVLIEATLVGTKQMQGIVGRSCAYMHMQAWVAKTYCLLGREQLRGFQNCSNLISHHLHQFALAYIHLAVELLLSRSCLAHFSNASVSAVELMFLLPSATYKLVAVPLALLISLELSHLLGVFFLVLQPCLPNFYILLSN